MMLSRYTVSPIMLQSPLVQNSETDLPEPLGLKNGISKESPLLEHNGRTEESHKYSFNENINLTLDLL